MFNQPALNATMSIDATARLTVERGQADVSPYAIMRFHGAGSDPLYGHLSLFVDHDVLDQIILELTSYRDSLGDDNG